LEKWVPASSVDGLVDTGSPSTTLDGSAAVDIWMTRLQKGWAFARHYPLVSSVIGLIASFLLFGLALPLSETIASLFAFIYMGFFVATAVLAVGKYRTWNKRKLLFGMWEPIGNDGVYFQFTQDGALVRGDGIATRYRWLPGNKMELYVDDSSPKVMVDVLSLSKMELVLQASGQGGHFKKGMTFTEAEAKRKRDAVLGVAGALAGGAAMLALGGLAIFGKAAAGAIGDAVFDPALSNAPVTGGVPFSSASPAPIVAKEASAPTNSQQQEPRRLRVAALCGAIIVDDDGTLVTYKKKCESCGQLDPGTTRMQIRSGVTSGSFRCTKCGQMQETKIQGT